LASGEIGEPSAGCLSQDSTLDELTGDPGARAILLEYISEAQIDMIAQAGMGSITLREGAEMGGSITPAMADEIDAKLAALCGGETPAATEEPAAPTEATEEPVKIGVIGPWSGAYAKYASFVEWWEAVVEQQVEDMGGILDGRPVEFVNEDDESTTVGVAAAVKKLALDNDVVCIAAAGESNASMVVASNAAEEEQILNITPGTFDLSDYQYSVNSAWAPYGMDDPYIDFVINVLKPDTVAFLVSQSEETQNVRVPYASDRFEDADIEVLEVIAVPLDISDFSPYITQVKGLAPGVLLLNIDTAPENIAKDLPGLGGWGDTIVMGMTAKTTQVNTSQYPAAVGWYSEAAYVPGMAETYPAAKVMEEAWHKVNGDVPLVGPTAWYYTNFWAAVHAIELAGTTDRRDVADAARSGDLEFDCPYGHFKVNPDGTNALQGVLVKFLENGMFEVVQSPE